MTNHSKDTLDYIAVEVDKVKKRIKNHTKSKYQPVQAIIDSTMEGNGKMLRPTLLIMAAYFGNYESERMVNLASAIEILHMATLVHDDIIDEAELRRNLPSVQSKYGKDMAVYTGDFLLSKSLTVFKPKEYEEDQIAQLSKVIERICESELLQYFNRYHTMTVRNYLRVISGKTAALFALSLYMGAKESGCDEILSRKLARIGYEIGIAFQIIDDILDFSEETEVVGKTVRNDLKKGYYTLPVIYAFEGKTFSPKDHFSVTELYEKILQKEGIEKARHLAKKYTSKAYVRIETLPDHPMKKGIKDIADKLLTRIY